LETLLRGGAYLNNRHPLRLNVGFLLHKNVGYSRNFDFDIDTVQVGNDVDVTALRGSINLIRTAQGVYLSGDLTAHRELGCVRCLTSFHQSLSVNLDDLFTYPPDRASDPLLIVTEDAILDLNPILREYLLLDEPIQTLCRQDCKGLCPECGVNANQTECDHPMVEVDPRLEALRALLPKS
jgi:uncharacterized protein